ncbi:hypothetical protein HPB52_009484 [Rhipicephalus sanguineus]|uniref:Uncharacterized protein n=1 Tax=Rhipicephalus sanguineus TaxID=34632 RepID=A0A9D4QFH2_RHISA|nr:hypothetical protein HPB52_009484 [Rhipicephalus sanguineus]
MDPPSTLVMENGIHSLDSARLLLMAERLNDNLRSGGVDLQASCSDVPGKTKCWLRLHLPAVNEVLWKVSTQLVEHAPARNKSVCEAELDQILRAHLDVKALEALLLANRTLHRLKFRYDSLPSKAPAMLARALEDNFVFLTLEFEYQHAQYDMHPVMRVLNRNRSLLNRAVECVLDIARDEHSTRALRLLSNSESLLDAVGTASGKDTLFEFEDNAQQRRLSRRHASGALHKPADNMEPASTGVRSLESAIKSLDSVRLLKKSESLHNKLKSRGVDLQVSCGIALGEAKCWLRWHLPVLNEVLWKACMQIIEHAPGAFTLSCVQGPDPDVQRTDASLLEGTLMVYRLLEYHRCIKRLVLGMSAVLLWHFPSMFGRALENDQGIVEAAGHHVDMGERWREMLRCGVLASALGKLCPGLDCLDVTPLVLDNAAAECIADGIRKSNLKRLHLCNNMSGRVARQLFAAVNTCQSLTSLHFAGYTMFSRSSAVALAAALKSNRTLRKLRVKFLDDDVLGLILASLKHNNTLQEMMFDFSADIPRTTLLDGLQALSANTAVMNGLARNKTVYEVEFNQNLRAHQDVKALETLLLANRTLRRLKFTGYVLPGKAPHFLARALEENFVFLTLEFHHYNDGNDLYPVIKADDMEPPPTGISGMESRIRSVDSARLLLVAEMLRGQLKSRGMDLQAPCSDVLGKRKCWLRLHLPAVNEVLWRVSMQLVEHAPGALTLSHVERADMDMLRADTSLMDGVIMLYSLLENHTCVKRLLLTPRALLLRYFPS